MSCIQKENPLSHFCLQGLRWKLHTWMAQVGGNAVDCATMCTADFQCERELPFPAFARDILWYLRTGSLNIVGKPCEGRWWQPQIQRNSRDSDCASEPSPWQCNATWRQIVSGDVHKTLSSWRWIIQHGHVKMKPIFPWAPSWGSEIIRFNRVEGLRSKLHKLL